MIAIALAAAALGSSQSQDPATQLEQLNHMYQQSCSVKAYGSYDDICSGLKKQMKEAQKRLKNEVRAQASNTAPPASTASQTTTPTTGFAPSKN